MMPKCSAIQEYYLCRQGARLANGEGTSNDDLRLMLLHNRRMLETIHRLQASLLVQRSSQPHRRCYI